jgi:hypothetical protein
VYTRGALSCRKDRAYIERDQTCCPHTLTLQGILTHGQEPSLSIPEGRTERGMLVYTECMDGREVAQAGCVNTGGGECQHQW